MTAAHLRDRLALYRRTFANLDEYARVRVQLFDLETAAPEAPPEAAPGDPPEPLIAPVVVPPAIYGGGVQLL